MHEIFVKTSTMKDFAYDLFSKYFIVSSLIVSIKSDKEILRKFDEVNWDQTMKKKL